MAAIGELEQALANAFFDTCVDDESKQGKHIYHVNKHDCSRQFMSNWLYIKNIPFAGDVRQAHGSFFFLLQKGISVTNITHAEAVQSLSNNAKPSAGANWHQARFLSNLQYRDHLRQLLWPGTVSRSFENEAALNRFVAERVKNLVDFYSDFFFSTIVINFYSTSYIVHIPTSISVDLGKVVFDSGYIHSVGNSIYQRRAEGAVYAELLSNLRIYIETFYDRKPIYFVPYSKEFFQGDEKGPISIKNGVDDVKLSARKHHIGEKSILALFDALSKSVLGRENKIIFPKSGDFHRERIESGADPRFSIFLVIDRSLRYSKTNRALEKGDELYISCYGQFLRNDNVLHVFKERKPGWSAPVTVPHTLSGSIAVLVNALLNGRKSPTILDPFCGTCTTLIDIASRIGDAKLIGLDSDHLVPVMIRDNLEFFRRRNDDFKAALLQIIEDIKKGKINRHSILSANKFLSEEGYPEPKASIELAKRFSAVVGTVVSYICKALNKRPDELRYNDFDRVQNEGFSKDFADGISKWEDIDNRLFLFFAWRALCLGSFRFHAAFGDAQLMDVLQDELCKCYLEVAYICDRDLDQKSRPGSWLARSTGTFSDHIQISQNFFEHSCKTLQTKENGDFLQILGGAVPGSINVIRIEDSIQTLDLVSKDTKGLGKRKVDAIVTDPPYGFNTHEGGVDRLESLFYKLPKIAAELLSENGVLCVVLPSQSKNGKQIPYFETQEVFIRQFIGACEGIGRRVLKIAQSLPENATFPQPPYWWRSDRGVSRHILLFLVE